MQEKLIEWAAEIKNVLQGELPLFAHEILNYNYYSSLIEIFICGIIIFLCVKILNVKDDPPKKHDLYNDNSQSFFAPIMVIIIIVFSLDLVHTLFKFIKINCAPRLFIFEYVMDLIKK